MQRNLDYKKMRPFFLMGGLNYRKSVDYDFLEIYCSRNRIRLIRLYFYFLLKFCQPMGLRLCKMIKQFHGYLVKRKLYLLVIFPSFCIIIMPKITNRSRKIPKFIKKLIQILDNPQYLELVSWLPTMNGFQIFNTSRFIDEVLPNFFRHKNMSSFVRQLNMYGFNRPKESDQHVYYHPRFIKGNMNSMRQIQRRTPEGNTASECEESEEHLVKIEQENLDELSLAQACEKLLIQNKKLKKQNQQLTQKLAILSRTKQMLSNFSQFNYLSPEQSQKKSQESFTSLNSEETMVEKLDEKPKIHSFSFGSNHDDIKSKLSYLSLLYGAKQGSKIWEKQL